MELIQLDETRRDATLANEAHKKRVKAQFDKNVKPRVFSEGDLVLLYDQESNNWEQVNLSLYGWAPIFLNGC